jgi:hypothetical protein
MKDHGQGTNLHREGCTPKQADRPFIFMEHPLSLEWYQIKTRSVCAQLADYIVYKYFQNNDEKDFQVRMYTDTTEPEEFRHVQPAAE